MNPHRELVAAPLPLVLLVPPPWPPPAPARLRVLLLVHVLLTPAGFPIASRGHVAAASVSAATESIVSLGRYLPFLGSSPGVGGGASEGPRWGVLVVVRLCYALDACVPAQKPQSNTLLARQLLNGDLERQRQQAAATEIGRRGETKTIRPPNVTTKCPGWAVVPSLRRTRRGQTPHPRPGRRPCADEPTAACGPASSSGREPH